MGIPAESAFDLGPLTWVKDEIDQALAKGLVSLSEFGAHPFDKTPLKQAQAHIHQAAGAVQIVGLDGAITLFEEIERHLLLLESLAPTTIGAEIDAIGAASRRLSRYLDDLAHGEAPVTLKLYPEYAALCHLRGNENASPTDLFFPDLSRTPMHLARSDRPSPRAQPAGFLRHQRRAYQQGLLRILRGDRAGIASMQQAIGAMEEALSGTPTAAFWWTVSGFLATVAGRDEPPGNQVKQLFARIDLQIRRFVEGSTKVADRLRREVLYHIAISPPPLSSPSSPSSLSSLSSLSVPRLDEIQSLYGLRAMLPPDAGTREIDLEQLRPTLKRSQELIAAVEEQWLRFTAGRREAQPLVRQSLDELEMEVRSLGEPALSNLVAALIGIPTVADDASGVSEALAMEFATAVLLTSDALNHFARLSPDFARQSEAMCRRLDLAQRGVVSLPSAGEELLDDMARRAQERLLLSNVAREIQANLRHMEKVLDAFFRDVSERTELHTLARYTGQIQGALQMLALPEAEQLLRECQKQIDAYAAGGETGSEELERLAESLSGLGFYIEAVEQQRPDALRMLDPFLHRAERAAAEAAGAPDVVVYSIESDLEAHREELPATVARFRAAPEDPTLRAELDVQLQSMKHDADLVADIDFSAQAASALEALHDAHAPAAKVLATLDDLTLELPAAAPEPSAETKRLLKAGAAGDETFGLELSDIFVTEAGEVLASIDHDLATCRQQPRNTDALLSIRRGFHTLKGSGRMVGQLALGDSAYRVETLLNRWLDEERPITAQLLALLESARRSFGHWVEELRTRAEVVVDDRALVEAIERIDADHQPAPQAMELHDEVMLREEATPHAEATPRDYAMLDEPDAVATPAVLGKAELIDIPDVLDIPDALDRLDIPGVLGLPHTFVTPDMPAAPHAAAPDLSAAKADIAVGTVHVSPALYQVLLEESSDLLRTLEREVAALQFDPRAAPSDPMIRAAHTLHGIHRTAGFLPVAETAEALESTLAAMTTTDDRPNAMLPTLAAAIESLAELVDFIGMRQAFGDAALGRAAEAARSLEQLRNAAEHSAAPAAAPPPVAGAEAERSAAPAPLPTDALEAHAEADLLQAARLRERAEAVSSVRDELDPQLVPIFLDEANELFPRAGALLRDWRRAPHQQQFANDLRRALHTLKGSARMAGAMRLGELTHLMETRLEEVEGQPATPALFDALDADLDQQAALLESLQDAIARPQSAATSASGSLAAVDRPRSATIAAQKSSAEGRSESWTAEVAADSAADSAAQQQVTVRVRADVIDRLVNETGEVSIARARIEGELRSLKSNLLELTTSVIRLRGQVREIEMQAETQIQSQMSHANEAEGFDPLEFDRYTRFQELARSLTEGVNDVATVQQSLLKNLDDADAALMAQARLSRDVQQQLLAVRTVPFASISERLYRVLRQTAKELDKKANLEIRGGQTELDRGVLDKLIAPLEHLLRNAIDHGIEDPAERRRVDKSAVGEIAITVRQEGNEIALTVTDDGSGLPLPEIKAKAIELGLFAPEADPSDTQLIDAIFAPGFSTAQEVSRISGRGIGMDVVRNDIHALGGRIEVATTPGRGTVFTMYLPLTLAVTQAVLVRAAGRVHALPAALVEQVQQIKADNLVRHYANGALSWQTRTYPFHYLPQLLGDTESGPDPQRYNPVLLLKSANQYVAVHVDQMLGNQEIVIKNAGAQLARLPGFAGATVLGNGEIVLILNPVQLLARHAQNVAARSLAAQNGEASGAASAAAAIEPRHAASVLVVDDSLTVRKITSRLLAREGYDVASARDGVDALQWLADHSADVILLDIEMPRMDGFEFAKTIRNDPRLQSIPIIMITSRTADKHRARATELGIEAYLGKPFQEEELLRCIKRLVSKPTPEVAAHDEGRPASLDADALPLQVI